MRILRKERFKGLHGPKGESYNRIQNGQTESKQRVIGTKSTTCGQQLDPKTANKTRRELAGLCAL